MPIDMTGYALEFRLRSTDMKPTRGEKAMPFRAALPVATMAERVGNGRGHEAEPAHVFIAGEESAP